MNQQKTSNYSAPSLSKRDGVISAGIAEIQKPRMASYEHLPVLWIPAIPAGMTT